MGQIGVGIRQVFDIRDEDGLLTIVVNDDRGIKVVFVPGWPGDGYRSTDHPWAARARILEATPKLQRDRPCAERRALAAVDEVVEVGRPTRVLAFKLPLLLGFGVAHAPCI